MQKNFGLIWKKSNETRGLRLYILTFFDCLRDIFPDNLLGKEFEMYLKLSTSTVRDQMNRIVVFPDADIRHSTKSTLV